MASREPSRAKKSVSLSVVLGTLLVPLSAYAASSLVAAGTEPNPETVAQGSQAAETGFTEQSAIAADLEAACGGAGLEMVAAETAGSITDLQQAALDALRQICVEQGRSLPAPHAPDPVAQNVVSAETQLSPTPLVVDRDHDDEDDDHGRHGGDDDDDDDDGNDD
jgi:hypothetical protein